MFNYAQIKLFPLIIIRERKVYIQAQVEQNETGLLQGVIYFNITI